MEFSKLKNFLSGVMSLNIKLHHKSLDRFHKKTFEGLIFHNNGATSDRVIRYREFFHPSQDKITSSECDLFILPDGEVNELYALTRQQIEALPIKVKEKKQFFLNREDKACYLVSEYASFKITPIKEMELFDLVQPFIMKHSNPDEFEVFAVINMALLLGKGAVWISGNRAYGKSSIFKTMNKVFGSVPVRERVKTVPAFFKYIPEDGIMVIDEMAKKDAESSENLLYALNIMGDINEDVLNMNTGGSAAFGTNVPKSLRNCSTVCIMNKLCDYESKDKFAEYMFSNNIALDRRFLKLKVSDSQIDMAQFGDWKDYTDEEMDYLRKMVRTAQYYRPHRTESGWRVGYKLEANQKWVENAFKYAKDKYQQTHIETIRLFFEVFSVYAKNDYVKFSSMVETLFKMIEAYQKMVNEYDDSESESTQEFKMQDTTKVEKKDEVIKMTQFNAKQSLLSKIDEELL